MMFGARVMAATLFAAMALAETAAAQHVHEAPLAIPGLGGFGGPFQLVDQDGRVRSDADFHGKLLLVTFGYTNCPDVCPLDLQKTAQALEQAGPAVAARVTAVFITIDPERDTPERLKEFITPFSRDIIGLTGPAPAIAAVAQSYRVHVALHDHDGHGAPEHSEFQYLMGVDGKFLTLIPPAATATEIAARLTKYAPSPQG